MEIEHKFVNDIKRKNIRPPINKNKNTKLLI